MCQDTTGKQVKAFVGLCVSWQCILSCESHYRLLSEANDIGRTAQDGKVLL